MYAALLGPPKCHGLHLKCMFTASWTKGGGHPFNVKNPESVGERKLISKTFVQGEREMLCIQLFKSPQYL